MAIVSIKSQRVTFYDADGWILRAPVSSGTTGRETPAGVFAVVEKEKDHHSSLYDDAWMPNMQRITWSGIALHGGPLPGYAASHGCVRMPYGFAENVFDKTHIGMRVIIAPGDAEPVAFSHPSLLVPNQAMIDAAPARADALARAADDATEAAAAVKTTVAIAKREAAPAAVAVPKLERLASRADAELARAEKALVAARTDEAKAMAEDVKQKAAAKVEALHAQFEAAAADQKAKQEAVAAAKRPSRRPRPNGSRPSRPRRTRSSRSSRCRSLSAARRRSFMCGATRMSGCRTGARVRRTLESRSRSGIPTGRSVRISSPRSRAPRGACAGPRSRSTTADSAKDALDRISFPQEVLARVAPTAVPGSSIIVSDEPLNSETNYRTEFVVVLNNQPQGGLAMRKRPDAVAEARGDGFFGFNPFLRDPNAQYGAARARGGQSYYPPQQRSW